MSAMDEQYATACFGVIDGAAASVGTELAQFGDMWKRCSTNSRTRAFPWKCRYRAIAHTVGPKWMRTPEQETKLCVLRRKFLLTRIARAIRVHVT